MSKHLPNWSDAGLELRALTARASPSGGTRLHCRNDNARGDGGRDRTSGGNGEDAAQPRPRGDRCHSRRGRGLRRLASAQELGCGVRRTLDVQPQPAPPGQRQRGRAKHPHRQPWQRLCDRSDRHPRGMQGLPHHTRRIDLALPGPARPPGRRRRLRLGGRATGEQPHHHAQPRHRRRAGLLEPQRRQRHHRQV